MANAAEIRAIAGALLGEVGITDADPELASGIVRIYDIVRDELLYETPWSWMLRREKLPPSPLDPGETPRYPRKFSLPDSNIGQIRALYSTDDDMAIPKVYGWTREGNWIYASWDSVWLEYQTIVDEEAFPALFVNALSLLLAARCAVLVLEDPDMGMHFERLADNAKAKAQRVDAQSKPPESITNFSYIEAHYGGTDSLFNRYD